MFGGWNGSDGGVGRCCRRLKCPVTACPSPSVTFPSLLEARRGWWEMRGDRRDAGDVLGLWELSDGCPSVGGFQIEFLFSFFLIGHEDYRKISLVFGRGCRRHWHCNLFNWMDLRIQYWNISRNVDAKKRRGYARSGGRLREFYFRWFIWIAYENISVEWIIQFLK